MIVGWCLLFADEENYDDDYVPYGHWHDEEPSQSSAQHSVTRAVLVAVALIIVGFAFIIIIALWPSEATRAESSNEVALIAGIATAVLIGMSWALYSSKRGQ